MMKAFWLVVCPLAYFIHGPVKSSGIFCQVSGFFLTAAIESADVAVLMIALHTALTLLRPGRSASGGAGLYPYRRLAYFCWVVIPLGLAAVVPLSGNKFVDDGPNCYLPVSPTWYRLTLSWIPRYIIFLIIILTYAGIYVYIRLQLVRFGRDQRRASVQSMSSCLKGDDHHHRFYHRHHREKRGRSIPVTPVIANHGLLDSVQVGVVTAEEPRGRQLSAASTITMLKLEQGPAIPKPALLAQREPISWNQVDFGCDGIPGAAPQPPRELDVEMGNPETQPAVTESTASRRASGEVPDEPPIPSPRPHSASPPPTVTTTQNRLLWRRPLTVTVTGAHSISESVYNIFGILRRGPPEGRRKRWRHSQAESTETTATATSTARADSIHLPTDEMEEAMGRSRERMQRQLRLLFVYPTVYVLTWIAPFVSHAIGFNDDFTKVEGGAEDGSRDREPPFGLQVATVASLCVGAAVDCCFFSAWERPWRQVQRGFGEALARRLRLRLPMSVVAGAASSLSPRSTGSHSSASQHGRYYYYYRHHSRRGPGRTREERAREARLALLRRDKEVLERLNQAAAARSGDKNNNDSKRPPRKEWWDALNGDEDDYDHDHGRDNGDNESGEMVDGRTDGGGGSGSSTPGGPPVPGTETGNETGSTHV